MTTVLCTLYNSLYLDKGLVLYDSLCECAKDFKLYVLCMDDKCYEVLTDLKQEHHIPVRLSDFEEGDEELLVAKANRSMGEYCWTCSSSFIRYVLMHYNEDSCTYIDADMYFYNDPKVLIDEMRGARKSVMVVPHRFPEEKMELAKKVGTYCVEFNTFLNTPESLEVLDYWRNRCLECCSNLNDGIHWGDQKYLEELVDKYACVHVCKHPGAGIAPWNISLYNLVVDEASLNMVYLNQQTKPVFFHFQGITNINAHIFVLGGIVDNKSLEKEIINVFYGKYLSKCKNKRNSISENYGVYSIITGHPTSKHHLVWLKNTFIGGYFYYLFLKLIQKAVVVKIS